MTKVTFVLPCTGNSGGVRVTLEMATQLATRGYDIRIAYRLLPIFSKERVLDRARLVLRHLQGSKDFDWIRGFRGVKEPFTCLSNLSFSRDEIVIAVGEHTVKDVYELDAGVFKLRYCHGFVDRLTELNKAAWGGPMPTITVTPALIPRLEVYSGENVLGVVPNGIRTTEYYLEDRIRDGIGLVFRNIPQKGPKVARALVKIGRAQLPEVPWHMFGTSRRPKEFGRHEYRQFPSVAKARETYNRCKIWLITSSDEGFCLPILEAMACGSVVITSNHLVASDLIEDGVNGFIVPYGDVGAYMRKIDFLLKHEVERKKLVSEGFNTVQRFTWDGAAREMEMVLSRLKGKLSEAAAAH